MKKETKDKIKIIIGVLIFIGVVVALGTFTNKTARQETCIYFVSDLTRNYDIGAMPPPTINYVSDTFDSITWLMAIDTPGMLGDYMFYTPTRLYEHYIRDMHVGWVYNTFIAEATLEWNPSTDKYEGYFTTDRFSGMRYATYTYYYHNIATDWNCIGTIRESDGAFIAECPSCGRHLTHRFPSNKDHDPYWLESQMAMDSPIEESTPPPIGSPTFTFPPLTTTPPPTTTPPKTTTAPTYIDTSTPPSTTGISETDEEDNNKVFIFTVGLIGIVIIVLLAKLKIIKKKGGKRK